jgi:peptidoglycan/LPS O-acetylase OafA/YrhL
MTSDVTNNRSIPSLDGLRGIAVLLVVAAHIGWLDEADRLLQRHHHPHIAWVTEFDAGDLGVSIFFVISGFLITTLLIRHDDSAGRVSLKNFYVRRFFRIFPPYYAYLLAIAALWALHMVPMLPGAFASAALYVSNYYPYRVSQPGSVSWLVGHSWSLSLEEQFYMLWPACLHWLGRRRSAALGVVLIVLAPLARVLTLHFAPGSMYLGQIDRMFHTRIDTIMAGCVLALLGAWPRLYGLLLRGVTARWTAWGCMTLLFLTLHLSWSSPLARDVLGIGIEAILLAYLLWYSIRNAEGWAGRILNNRWLRHIGVISYSLYLWQQLFDGPVNLLGIHRVRWLWLILVAAELSYYLIERPSFRIRDRFIARRTSEHSIAKPA